MKRYNTINGLRTIACTGIILMHVKNNINYTLENSIINMVIDSFTQFVFLFMIISSFGMCCGYYDKIKYNKISIEDFYKKRFLKILPFFITLIIVDVLVEHNIQAVIEGFTDATLMFGFLQKDIGVLGVAWFLGLVFLFYMIFPFFVFIISNKKRAWYSMIIAVFMNFVASGYFNVDRTNMFYSFVFFLLGGLIYLYKDNIEIYVKKYKIIFTVLTVATTISYFIIPQNIYLGTLQILIIFTFWIMLVVGGEKNVFLNNRFTEFISKISMEMYLAHMIVFRILEKLNLTKIFSNNYLSYIITSALVIIGVICGAIIFNVILKKIKDMLDIKLKRMNVINENSVGE